jgi:5-methylcytosine-specific restriction endonuclease McrA
MELELSNLEIKMKGEILIIKNKYKELKINIKKKYKKIKPKRISIPIAVKNKLWDINFGPKIAEGLCYVCEVNIINIRNFECGHIIPVSNGGDNNINNLKPICVTCNRSMGIKNLEEFKKDYFNINNNKHFNINNNKYIEKNINKSDDINKEIKDNIRNKNNKLNLISDLIRNIDIKKNINNNISTFTKNNFFLDKCISNTPGIINVSYLKNEKLANIISTLSSSGFFYNSNLLSCKYGIPCVDERIKFIKILVSQIEPYKEIMEELNIIFDKN